MCEAAHFLTFAVGDARAGLALAREAVRLCPAGSAEVHNELGDCLFELGRLTEARRCYGRALAVSADDVRARYNLAFVHIREGEHERALVRLAEALARDGGAYRERLLHKQAEVLGLLERQGQMRLLGRADRVAGLGPGAARTNGPQRLAGGPGGEGRT